MIRRFPGGFLIAKIVSYFLGSKLPAEFRKPFGKLPDLLSVNAFLWMSQVSIGGTRSFLEVSSKVSSWRIGYVGS
jgi:hypothetical protein